MGKKNKKRRGSRYKARVRAMTILYEAELRDEDPVEILAEHNALSTLQAGEFSPVAEYAELLVRGASEELDAVDDAVANNLDSGWVLDRLPAVDRAILRVAAWEILFNPEVPPLAAAIAGVDLAAEFSTASAPIYINAVLDALVKSSQRDVFSETSADSDERSKPSVENADDHGIFDTAGACSEKSDDCLSQEEGSPSVDSPDT